jgi:hypothetical protein
MRNRSQVPPITSFARNSTKKLAVPCITSAAPTGATYASGVDNTVSRVTSLSDGGGTTLESYSYLGLGTVAQETRPQTGVNLSYIIPGGNPDGGDHYTGLDRFGRVDQQLFNPSCYLFPARRARTARRLRVTKLTR